MIHRSPPAARPAHTIVQLTRVSVLALALAVVAARPADAAIGPAGRVVDQLHQTLVGAMRNADTLGFDGRYRQIEPAVMHAFHLGVMIRVIASRYWSAMTEPQQTALVDAFSRFTVATYADRFNGYSGERFETLEERPAQRDSVWVLSRLVKSDGEVIELNYLMRQFGEDWRIVDVYLKGTYSEIATKRSEYSAILRDQGVAGLIRQLDSKAASFRARSK